jgi:hypothetical protein
LVVFLVIQYNPKSTESDRLFDKREQLASIETGEMPQFDVVVESNQEVSAARAV